MARGGKVKKVGLITLSMITISVFGSLGYVKYQEYAIERDINGLRVPPAWNLIDEKKAPAIPLCGDKNGCPSVVRTWILDRVYSKEDLQRLSGFSDRSITITRLCEELSEAIQDKGIPICAGDNYKSAYPYTYRLFQTVDSGEKNVYKVTIFVKKKT